MVIANFLQRTGTIDAGQGVVAVVFVEVEAGLLMTMLLQQVQAVPGEVSFSQWITLAVVLSFFDAPAQRS